MTAIVSRTLNLSSCQQRSSVECFRLLRQFPLRYRHHDQHQGTNGNPFVRYIRQLKWVPIPLGVGFAYISYQQFNHVVEREKGLISRARHPEEAVAKEWQVNIYKAMPLKIMSRLWGRVNNLELPVFMRSPLLSLYIWAFGCNMEEAAIGDLEHYRNLGEFFKRRLKPQCRPIDTSSHIVCPSDGKVLHFGRVERGLVEQVKGITYTLQGFLGPQNWPSAAGNEPYKPLPGSTSPNSPPQDAHKLTDVQYEAEAKCGDSENCLYHCVIYLAPGDYHGFHSPTEWTCTFRRHFPGELLSVNPGIARWVKGLFNLNERAVYVGEWQHGLFAMAAVGATNVGSIKIYHDKQLETNSSYAYPPGTFFDEVFQRPDTDGIPFSRGESFGEFNLGSTIVIVFEAPKDFKFKVMAGQKVKYGETLGEVGSENR